MGLSVELRHLLKEGTGEERALLEDLGEVADERVDKLGEVSPIYRNFLQSKPALWSWLEDEDNLTRYMTGDFLNEVWERDFMPEGDNKVEPFLHALQRLRRQFSLRIAYREVNEIDSIHETFSDLSLLAEFCVEALVEKLSVRMEQIYGKPWNEDLDEPPRFCVLGLGKLGGEELNFCSDIDLIYTYRGQGHCIKKSGKKGISTQEYYTILCQELTKCLSNRSMCGFLYNVDLRLRPDGHKGLIVRSFTAMENYYYMAGQTWERMALIKARPIAGDLALGEQLLEELNPFRYPRTVPPSINSEIAGFKLRIDSECIKDGTDRRDIKRGYGGIREIEFIVHGLQLINSGKHPFLQTPSTREGLESLVTYKILGAKDAVFLNQAYEFYRRIENRIQMQEEIQVTVLPNNEEALGVIVKSLGYDCIGSFNELVREFQEGVHEIYKRIYPTTDAEKQIQEWTLYFSGKKAEGGILERLRFWLGEDESEQQRLRNFLIVNKLGGISRELILIFMDMIPTLDEILLKVADPAVALERIGQIAENYGPRRQLFKAFVINPSLLKALALICDTSNFIYRLLCLHPEILEELFDKPHAKQKTVEEMMEEISRFPQDETFPKYLWLYVKAEQVRLTIGQLLFEVPIEEIEFQLSQLADACIRYLLEMLDPEGELAVIGFGKYGSEALSMGSDLDLMVIGKANDKEQREKVQRLVRTLDYSHPLNNTYSVDMRLRPFGEDGAMVVTLGSFGVYHEKHAKVWEKQVLTHGRFVAGNVELGKEYGEKVESIIYGEEIERDALGSIREMFKRVQLEKLPKALPECSFKYASGGLMDIEFTLESVQLCKGHEHEGLRTVNIRKLVGEMAELKIISDGERENLVEGYRFLRRIEFYLRRNSFKAKSAMEEMEHSRYILGKWLGYEDGKQFWEEYRKCLDTNKKLLISIQERLTN